MTRLDLDAQERARAMLEAGPHRAEVEWTSTGGGHWLAPAPVGVCAGSTQRVCRLSTRFRPKHPLVGPLFLAVMAVVHSGDAQGTPDSPKVRRGEEATERADLSPADGPGGGTSLTSATPAVPPAPSDRAPDGKARIDVNVAGVDELLRLPGIGPRKAAAIVALRDKRRVTRPTQLLLVKGVGRKTLEKMLPYLSFPKTGDGRRARERAMRSERNEARNAGNREGGAP